MAIKPSPTIAGKLRKLFNNNKQTIEPAIGDSIPGGSGGGNVLTLYLGEKDNKAWAYKNPECTEEYESSEEATTALANANVVILQYDKNAANKIFPVSTVSVGNTVFAFCYDSSEEPFMAYLYFGGGGTH